MGEYRHNHLLFLSDPLVAPDNNLCEQKAWVLKGKINQSISLHSLEHLADFCDCLSVLDHLATEDDANLYQSVKGIIDVLSYAKEDIRLWFLPKRPAYCQLCLKRVQFAEPHGFNLPIPNSAQAPPSAFSVQLPLLPLSRLSISHHIYVR